MRLFPLSNGFVNLDLVRRVCDRSGYYPTGDGNKHSKVSVSVEYLDGDVNEIGGADALRLLDFLRYEAAASTAGYAGSLAAIEDDDEGPPPIFRWDDATDHYVHSPLCRCRECRSVRPTPIVVDGGVPEF
jgi:hypothetical protein